MNQLKNLVRPIRNKFQLIQNISANKNIGTIVNHRLDLINDTIQLNFDKIRRLRSTRLANSPIAPRDKRQVRCNRSRYRRHIGSRVNLGLK